MLYELRKKLLNHYDTIVLDYGKEFENGKYVKKKDVIDIVCDYAYGYHVYNNKKEVYFDRSFEKCISFILDYVVKNQKKIKEIGIRA